jgi:tRNA-modifying protein YgfZ
MIDREFPPLPEQYAALRSGAGIVELVGWSSVTLTGADRHTFLHNFCTNDVKRLTPGSNCEAFITNVKGKIVGHGLVTCREEELVIFGSPGQGARLVEHFDRYIIREDVKLRDTSEERAYLLATVVKSISDLGFRISDYIEWNLLATEFCGLLETAPAGLAGLRESLVGRGAVDCSMSTFDVLRIEGGTPLYGIDFDERNLPQEVGRDAHAISFTKGCYLGQETVARIDAMGHVNQRLAGVRFLGGDVPAAGAELTESGSPAGRITSATRSLRLDAPLALAMLRRGHDAIGTQLESSYGPCEVIALPLMTTSA